MIKRRHMAGFTLVELMLVVAIIGMLAAIALPSYSEYTDKARRTERFELLHPAREALAVFYDRWGRFPANNAEAGLTSPDTYRGLLVQSVEVRPGAIVVTVKKKQQGNELCQSLWRAAINQRAPTAALLWVRDADALPAQFAFAPGAEDSTRLADREWCPK